MHSASPRGITGPALAIAAALLLAMTLMDAL